MTGNPKGPVTDLLRKLKYDTDAAIKNLQSFTATLGELMPRVEEVEALETRAAAAKRQFDDATKRHREIELGLVEAKATYDAIQYELGGAATQLTTPVTIVPISERVAQVAKANPEGVRISARDGDGVTVFEKPQLNARVTVMVEHVQEVDAQGRPVWPSVVSEYDPISRL